MLGACCTLRGGRGGRVREDEAEALPAEAEDLLELLAEVEVILIIIHQEIDLELQEAQEAEVVLLIIQMEGLV